MNFYFILNSAALGFGLAMDAFSVSLANGLHEPKMSRRRMCGIAGVYTLFQYLMPMTGWACVRTAAGVFQSFRKYIPWIALLLLLYIGGKMILEGIAERNADDDSGPAPVLSPGDLFLQGIATSIDALSVGFAIAEYHFFMANACSAIIGAVTFAVCFSGLAIGKKAGTGLSWKASVLGGCILVVIGAEIFIRAL